MCVLAAQCVTRPGADRRTGCVSELVLLPFYPVLERLCIAPRDLDLLLDRLLIHVGHATQSLPGVGGEGSVAKGEAARQAIQGPCRERSSPDTETRAGTGGKTTGNGDRGALSRCNCSRRGSDSGGRSWGLWGWERCSGVLERRGTRARAGVQAWLAERQQLGARSKGRPPRQHQDTANNGQQARHCYCNCNCNCGVLASIRVAAPGVCELLLVLVKENTGRDAGLLRTN